MKFSMLHPTTDEAHPCYDQDITVNFEVSAGCKGMRDSLGGVRGAGAQLTPDEDPELKILSITNEAGEEIELTDDETEAVDLYFWEHEDAILPEPDYEKYDGKD